MRRREFFTLLGGATAWPLTSRAQEPTMPVIGLLTFRGANDVPKLLAAIRQGLKETGFVETQNVAIEYRFAEITGVTQLNVVVAPKRLELLHELVPSAHVVGLLTDAADSTTSMGDLQAAARSLGLELHALNASSDADLEAVFAKLIELQVGGLVIAGAFFNARVEQLAALALRHRVPAVFESRDFFAAGGLASYGGSLTDSYRQAGIYAGRVLKGEKAGELPVQLGTKVEMFLNLKTAKTLGITVPLPLLGRADEVIE